MLAVAPKAVYLGSFSSRVVHIPSQMHEPRLELRHRSYKYETVCCLGLFAVFALAFIGFSISGSKSICLMWYSVADDSDNP